MKKKTEEYSKNEKEEIRTINDKLKKNEIDPEHGFFNKFYN